MFCHKCGKENPDDKKFCGDCGTQFETITKSDSKTPKKFKNDMAIGIIVIIILLVSLLWSLSMLGVHVPFFGKPHVNIDDISGDQNFKGKTITFRIYNSGDGTANNVGALINFYDSSTLKSLGSKSVYIGNLAPGESRQITTDLGSNYQQDLKFKITPITIT